MNAVLPASSRLAGLPTFGWMRAIAERERDVRDMLWLLLALTWVLAPHVGTLPAWASLSIAALIAWRAWLTWTGRRLPNRWIPIALTCVAGISVWLQYRTIFGKDAGVAYVALLLGLKLLEMRARRDIFIVIFLCLFVMLTALFDSQSMAMGAMLLVGLWMLVTALVSVQFAEHEPPWRKKAGIALRLTALGLPLMAVLFVLFPRIEGPLWGMPSDAYAAKTGLSDVMAPGSFGRLAESREIAFRVRFEQRVPPPAVRYWRGPVLGAFDGRAWSPLPARVRAVAPSFTVAPESVIDYTMTLEPNNRTWLFALDAPASDGRDRNVGGVLQPRVRSDLQVVSDRIVRERMRYSMRSFTDYRVAVDETRARLQEWLETPPGFNPRTHALAASLLASEQRPSNGRRVDDAAVTRRLVARALAMIRTEGFAYTLDPPALGRDSIDDFLFETKSGYCEHYASAFVFLMRALDVPARVVTGYQGGELNPVDGFLEVRQRDAHAWAEVWIAGAGWTRVDPTAAVAPDRIERGAAAAFDGAQGFMGSDTWIGHLLQSSRFNWDAVGNAWDQWILAYNADRQGGLLSGLGVERIDWQTLTVLLLIVFGAVLGTIGALTLFRRVRIDPVTRQYERACALVARLARASGSPALAAGPDHWARRPSEGPRAFLLRVGRPLPPATRERVAAVFALYEDLRYGRPRTAAEDQQLRARFMKAVGALRERGLRG